jgi:hypothetical protein
MHALGFEPMIPVFERAKMVHALNRTATVTKPRLKEIQSWQKKNWSKMKQNGDDDDIMCNMLIILSNEMYLTGVEFDYRQFKQGPNREFHELNYSLFSITDLRYVNTALTE